MEQAINIEPLSFSKTDGGRKQAGYKGNVGDCVIRCLSIILVTKDPGRKLGNTYQEIYNRVAELNKGVWSRMRKAKRKSPPSPREYTYKKATKKLMEEYGGKWTPTMQIGSGCQVHLRREELPAGHLAVSVSKHITTVINHTIHDTHNPDRGGDRCVYGYWEF